MRATGVLNFNLDLGGSVQLARPFSLDLESVKDSLPEALKVVASLVGLSASGNLAVSASANLELRLGLDLAGPVVVTTTTQGDNSPTVNEIQTLLVKATSGTYTIAFDKNGDKTIGAGRDDRDDRLRRR